MQHSEIHISEQVNTNPADLDMLKFLVDDKLKDVELPFPNIASCLLFVGKSRSGKSSLITSLLTSPRLYSHAFHNVIICIPQNSFQSMNPKTNPFLKLSEEKIYHDFDVDILTQILHQVQEYASENENTLLIIDDMTSQLKDPSLLRLLLHSCNNRRHYRLSIWYSTQVYNMVPLVCRKTVNYIILFKTTQKKEIESLWSEASFLTRDEFKSVLDYVFDAKYNFLVMDRDDNSYWKMFNKLIITGGDTNDTVSSSNPHT